MKQIYLTVMGHKDHGKSTLVGQIFRQQGFKIKNLAYMTDYLAEERRKGMTIKTGHNKLRLNDKMVLFADAPGHRRFLPEIDLTTADAILLLVDAQEGIKPGARSHIQLAKKAGVKQVICIINKMDLVNYRQERFLQLRQKVSRLLKDFTSVSIIPASALKNENIVQPSSQMPWYEQNNVKEAILALESKEHDLVQKSQLILRETVARFKRPILLWAGGKDSTTTLTLARMAFGGKVPFPVYFIDTTFKFPETYQYIRKYAKKWRLDFHQFKNEAALKRGVNYKDYPVAYCCHHLKTLALKKLIKKAGADGVIVSIRWSEHGVRGKETFFSRRSDHTRVHPLLEWSEEEVWDFLNQHKIPLNPLYHKKLPGGLRYRSIGCQPCTQPVPADELRERAGRQIDKEEQMEQLRAMGYM